jgi:Fe-S cluster assembly protein SufD
VEVLSTKVFEKLKIENTKAFEQFKKLGIPNKKWEGWQFTDISKKFSAPHCLVQHNNENINTVELPFQHKIVLVNGEIISSSLPDGVILKEVDTEKWDNESPIDTLNASFKAKTLLLTVLKKTVIAEPIAIVNHYTAKINEMALTRIKTVIEDFAEISIIEYSEGPEAFYNYSNEIICHDNSKVYYTQVQNFSEQAQALSSLSAQLGKNAQFFSLTINLGAKVQRQNINVDLNEDGATASIDGVFALTGTQHNDVYTRINHNHAHTYSNQLYKGILDQESRGVFSGLIYVPKDSQKINSEQLSKNLLLSKKARINTMPTLEVYADDVKCAHGATVGQLSEDEIFYLTSRGINVRKAKKLLCQAFGIEVIEKLKSENLRQWLTKLFVKKLDDQKFGHFEED